MVILTRIADMNGTPQKTTIYNTVNNVKPHFSQSSGWMRALLRMLKQVATERFGAFNTANSSEFQQQENQILHRHRMQQLTA